MDLKPRTYNTESSPRRSVYILFVLLRQLKITDTRPYYTERMEYAFRIINKTEMKLSNEQMVYGELL